MVQNVIIWAVKCVFKNKTKTFLAWILTETGSYSFYVYWKSFQSLWFSFRTKYSNIAPVCHKTVTNFQMFTTHKADFIRKSSFIFVDESLVSDSYCFFLNIIFGLEFTHVLFFATDLILNIVMNPFPVKAVIRGNWAY